MSNHRIPTVAGAGAGLVVLVTPALNHRVPTGGVVDVVNPGPATGTVLISLAAGIIVAGSVGASMAIRAVVARRRRRSATDSRPGRSRDATRPGRSPRPPR